MGFLAKSYLLSVAGSVSFTVASDVPQGAIAVPLVRANDLSYYLAEFQVGTPPQKEFLTMDTGSPTFSFLASLNPWCATTTKPCSKFGTFDNTTSSQYACEALCILSGQQLQIKNYHVCCTKAPTSIYEGPGFGDQLADFGGGDFLNDTVVIGGVSIPQLFFGYLSRYAFAPAQVANPTTTIAGLALQCGTGTGPKCDWAGPFLLPQLKNASAIDHMAVSFYLGPDDPTDTGSTMVLGGAYDAAKMAGEPFTLKMVDPSEQQTNRVNVTLMSVVAGGNVTNESFGNVDVGQPVLMDTGNPTWNVPPSIWSPVFAALGHPAHQNATSGAFNVSCDLRNLDASSNYIDVSFAGSDGQIKVPISALVTEFGDGTCGTFARNSSTSTLGGWGVPFLRSTYAIFDAENLEVTFAQVKYTTETEYVKLPQAGFGR